MNYSLTDSQKVALRQLVQQVREGHLPESFGVMWTRCGPIFADFEGDESSIPSIEPGMLKVLEGAGMLVANHSSKGTWNCTLTGKAYEAVDSDFEIPSTEMETRLSIGSVGAIVLEMSGGNIQAVGVADNTELAQIVNDPAALQSQLEDLTARLLDQVKSALTGTDLEEYTQAVRDFREQLSAEEPDLSLLKCLASKLAFLANIEGTISLIARVWPYLYPLVLVAETKLRQ